MDIDIRAITDEEIPAFRHRINRAFGGDASDDPEAVQRFREQVDLDRTYAGFDGDEMVATGATFTFDVSLPGGRQTPMGGLTMVSVMPTHRRRGLLNRIMDAHFADCQRRGEAVAGLWASESSIYGRYGFGDAAPVLQVKYDARLAGVPEAPDTVRIVDEAEARRVLPDLYAAVFAGRPGRIGRSEAWWEHRHFRDPEEWRQGATARRYVVAYRGGEPVGYTVFRQREKWENGLALGEIIVGEVIGVDADARLSVWSLVSSVDLFPNVKSGDVPVDFELPFQVANPRAIQRRLEDGMYLRVLDVPAAMSARGYEATGSLAFEVKDPLGFAQGTYLLDVAEDGSASCRPTDDGPDVVLDVATLSRLYLGSDQAGPLSRTGAIGGDAAAVAGFGDLMRTSVAPCCHEVY